MSDWTAYLLIRARMRLAGLIKEAGGCDHSVGVCMCSESALVQCLDAKLVEKFGMDLPYKFRQAAAYEDGPSLAKAREWANCAAEIISSLARERAIEED